MQTQMNYKKIITLISQDLSLPSPPAVAVKILNIVNQDEETLSQLGQVISTDPALTAKLLKIANSGIFRVNTSVNNINRAMTLLGTNIIKNIALSFVITDQFNNDNEQFFDFNLFWQRSVVTAIAAEKLNKLVQHKDDNIFISALLLHLGMVVIAQTKGSDYSNLRQEAKKLDKPLADAEIEKYGYNHYQVAYALLHEWNLPLEICELILFHPTPDQASKKHKKSSTILTCAEQIASICIDDEIVLKARLLVEELNTQFGLTIDQSYELYDQVAEESEQILSDFKLESAPMQTYTQLLQQATQELAKINLSNEQIILELTEARHKSDRLTKELYQANNRLRELVYRDALTGLYNHRFFHESLANELARAIRYRSSLSLLLFDVDYFKKINDSLGHQAGDLVLANISKAVSDAIRPSDIVSRYGGDEFAVVLPETNEAGAKVFAARLRRCVEGVSTLVDGQQIYITISIGVSSISKPTSKVGKESLIAAADKGLYISKENGRNQISVAEPCHCEPSTHSQ
jgi:diguanylate cyclase (GGDEF)-like protein